MSTTLDHILSLQQALAHYERMLAQSHPIYLSQLHIQAVKTKAGRGKAAIILTVVSVGVVLELTPTGTCELNPGLLS
jgi:magnesium transporter